MDRRFLIGKHSVIFMFSTETLWTPPYPFSDREKMVLLKWKPPISNTTRRTRQHGGGFRTTCLDFIQPFDWLLVCCQDYNAERVSTRVSRVKGDFIIHLPDFYCLYWTKFAYLKNNLIRLRSILSRRIPFTANLLIRSLLKKHKVCWKIQGNEWYHLWLT